MDTVYQLLALVGAGMIVWLLYRTVKGRPDMFNRDKMHNSFFTMGVLALILIVFVAFLVFLVRNT
jgi:hypothetical protein